MSIPKMLLRVPKHPMQISEALADMKKFLNSFNVDIRKLLKAKAEFTQAYLKKKKKSLSPEDSIWLCPIPLDDFLS
jgi:hypothetical protein